MRRTRDPMRSEERPGKGAHHEGMGQGRGAKDSTSVCEGTAGNRRRGRKSTTRTERRVALLVAMGAAA